MLNEEENNRVENGSLNRLGLNILRDHYANRNSTQDFVEVNSLTRQSEVDEVNNEAEISVNHQNSNTLIPLNTNITQDPDVWALANSIGECCSFIRCKYQLAS